MNKKLNGNWEDDKEIFHQVLQDGYDELEMLEIIYKYSFADGRREGLNQALEIVKKSVQHD